ncbi:MAG TPA: EF-hand domain-containing protein [Albitalea sp.]|uniref:EF-hand domain-containing protein n=1 Tax=Piscinibacter sp. TaxID=1903157 RepID=UPI002ED3D4F4
MTTRSLLAIASVPVLLAGLTLGAYAQTKAPSTEQPAAKGAVEAAFKKADANGDGKLSKEEAAKLPAVGSKFDELDKDKDGSLSPEEFSAGYSTAS